MFSEYDSLLYSGEGTEEFKKSLQDENYLAGIEYYGAFDDIKEQEIFDYIKDNQYIGKEARKQHKQNVISYKENPGGKEKHKKICPQCKTELVLRKGKNGEFLLYFRCNIIFFSESSCYFFEHFLRFGTDGMIVITACNSHKLCGFAASYALNVLFNMKS